MYVGSIDPGNSKMVLVWLVTDLMTVESLLQPTKKTKCPQKTNASNITNSKMDGG